MNLSQFITLEALAHHGVQLSLGNASVIHLNMLLRENNLVGCVKQIHDVNVVQYSLRIDVTTDKDERQVLWLSLNEDRKIEFDVS